MTRRFRIIMNAASGNDAKDETRRLVLSRLQELGCTAEVVDIAAGADVAERCDAAVAQAKQDGAIVVAAGGDGTLNAIAAACHKQEVPMGVIPLGTFNYFARDLGIPLDAEAAATVLAQAPLRPVAAGDVNGRLFLVNASIGLYTQAIRNRENAKARFGRYRIVALATAIAGFFRRRVFAVTIDSDAGSVTRRTMMVFVCKNRFQLEKLGLAMAENIAPERLCLSVLRPVSRLQVARILFRSMLGAMQGESRVEEMAAPRFRVDTARRHLHAVLDGEIVKLDAPLEFRALPAALHVIAPQNGDRP